MTDERPFCECGNCDATARNGGREIRLPMDAWAVAGAGDPTRIAVKPGHLAALMLDGAQLTIERHRGWVAVGDAEL